LNGLLPSLGGVALFLAAGLGLAELVPAVRTLPWPRRLAWAYLLGIAGLAGALYALSHFLDVPLRRPAILATAAALILVGAVARVVRRGRPHPLAPSPIAPPPTGRGGTPTLAFPEFWAVAPPLPGEEGAMGEGEGG